jgi:pSer/pThr/pTyr-binding forkhead associated (FHA) protein
MLELVLLDGSDRRFSLTEGSELMVGVAAHCTVRLNAVDVSRAHALLTCQRGKATLLDLGSTNGTFVNGRRVKETELAPGDFIRFSSVMAQVMPPVSAGSRPGSDPKQATMNLPTDSRAPISDRMPVVLQESLMWLLSRWGTDGSDAASSLAEWLVQHRGMRGAAILEREGKEALVVATHGTTSDVLNDPAVEKLVLEQASAGPLESFDLTIAGRRVLAVKAQDQPWLLLLPSGAMPDGGEIVLFVRLMGVARRLDQPRPQQRGRG